MALSNSEIADTAHVEICRHGRARRCRPRQADWHLNLIVGSLRDEMRILSAVVLRPDDSMTALAREMRAHMARMDDWRRKLEGADE